MRYENMQPGIKTKKGPSQHDGAGPYLGGPTFNPLDSPQIDNNLSEWKRWADRYESLNGGE